MPYNNASHINLYYSSIFGELSKVFSSLNRADSLRAMQTEALESLPFHYIFKS